jgi:hypothetical protein
MHSQQIIVKAYLKLYDQRVISGSDDDDTDEQCVTNTEKDPLDR